MGFMDGLGDFMGKAAAMYQEMEQYKLEYEKMTDYELKKEYNDLKNKHGREERARFAAVRSVLESRGYGK